MRMRGSLRVLMALLGGMGAVGVCAGMVRGADVNVEVHTDKVLNTISPFVYGHFFEHIYNGGDNGIWGEMVWNRSFEDLGQDTGAWTVKDGVVAETALSEGARMFFGDSSWTDYEFTLQARKTRGNEGFMIIPRGTEGNWLWANLGGWNNTGHQLLYVGAQNQEIGQRGRGNIEMNRWYNVRVRNEGRHVQIWLDDQKVIDDTLPEGVDPPGGVGVATWMTAAEFKNFKVTDLKGKVLFQGVPDVPGMDGPGRHWDTFGTADIHLTDQGAYNDQYALSIKGTGSPEQGDVGVTQEGFCIRKGETYKGSLYQKGSAPHGGSVRFMSNGKAVAEISLPAPTDQWKECPIEFTAAEDAPDATLQIGFPANATVMLDQVSLMAEASIKNGGFRPDIYQAFADLKPTILRWPGGIYAEQYHWKNGIGPQNQRKKNLMQAWSDYDPNALGTDEYLALCKKVGAEPWIVINTGMHVTGTRNEAEWKPWIDEAAEWVQYCNGPADSPMGKLRAANGHVEPYHVKYWEIDNELWRSMQPRPQVYAQAVPLFAAAMKKVDPSVTILAHGGNAVDRDYDRALLGSAAVKTFDVLSIHHYTDADKFDTGVADQDALYKDVIGMIKSSAHPEVKLAVSEWNAQTTDWRTGLYAGAILNTFEKYGDTITLASPALLFRHTSATAWDNAFINFDNKGWFPAPNYVVMKLWRENFAPQRVDVAGDMGQLNLIATRTEKGDRVILKAVNMTKDPFSVNAKLDGGFIGSPAFELVAPGSLAAANSMEKPDAVKPAKANATLSNGSLSFTMPAFSAGVISIPRGN